MSDSIAARFTFRKVTLNVAKATTALNRAIDLEVREGAREFVKAIWPLVPVDTGTARGSIRTLGRVLQIAIPIDPQSSRRGRGPGIGEQLGEFKFTPSREPAGHAAFQFTTNVEWFAKHEHGVWPPRWGAFDAGRAAFVTYIKNNLKKRIPRVTQALQRTEVV